MAVHEWSGRSVDGFWHLHVLRRFWQFMTTKNTNGHRILLVGGTTGLPRIPYRARARKQWIRETRSNGSYKRGEGGVLKTWTSRGSLINIEGCLTERGVIGAFKLFFFLLKLGQTYLRVGANHGKFLPSSLRATYASFGHWTHGLTCKLVRAAEQNASGTQVEKLHQVWIHGSRVSDFRSKFKRKSEHSLSDAILFGMFNNGVHFSFDLDRKSETLDPMYRA